MMMLRSALPYGQYWRDMRKLTMVELLSNSRLEMLTHVWDAETKLLMKDMHEKSIKNRGHIVVEMKEKFGDLTTNIIVRVLAGKRYFGTESNGDEESRKVQKALGGFFYLLGLFLVSDAVPFLGWLDSVRGYVGKMKRTAREMDGVFGSWVKEHRLKRLSGSINEEEKDFIHVLLSNLDDGKISAHDTDTTIKSTCLSLVLGGHETTMVTITWATSLLLNNRNVLEKAQDELDIQVVHLTVARLLHGFELATVSDTPIDMSEGPGMTLPKATPLEIILKPRLNSSLYEC
ncbi:unnamed protein product [Dovyalis caffra]|uniref:Cytochrome P450 n=1 Tax=Dovyalis caffra TaxID=77055 RepID=A0AAV1R8T2_9ROSI|nr:unnamed protein product [Dovyalis caffra]